MSKFVNIAGQAITSTGTGTLSLGDPVPGYNTFDTAGLVNGDVIGYVIWDNFGDTGPESREVGRGTYSAGTLTRDIVLASTESGNSALDCTPAAQVYVAATAEDIKSAHIGANPPDNPYSGQLWWDINTGTLFVYYRDIDSAQWIASANVTSTDVLPDQTGHGGKFLSTDSTSARWAELVPDYADSNGKFLSIVNGQLTWVDLEEIR